MLRWEDRGLYNSFLFLTSIARIVGPGPSLVYSFEKLHPDRPGCFE